MIDEESLCFSLLSGLLSLVLLVFVENESGVGGGPSPVGLVAGHHLGAEQYGVLRHVEAPNPFSLLLADGHVDGFPPIVAHDIDHAFDVGVVLSSVFFSGGGHLMSGNSEEIDHVLDEFVEENK